jgi:hypothetical protein
MVSNKGYAITVFQNAQEKRRLDGYQTQSGNLHSFSRDLLVGRRQTMFPNHESTSTLPHD